METTQLYEAFKQSMRIHLNKDGNQHQALACDIGMRRGDFSTFLNHSDNTGFNTFCKVYIAIGKDPRLLEAILLYDINPQIVELILDLIKNGKRKVEWERGDVRFGGE